jgi:hypothetical protein
MLPKKVYNVKVRFWFCKKPRWVASEKDAEARPEGAQRRVASLRGARCADGTEAAAIVEKLKDDRSTNSLNLSTFQLFNLSTLQGGPPALRQEGVENPKYRAG